MIRATLAPLVLLAALTLVSCDKIKDSLPWQRFSVASTSMEPTLPQGSYVTGRSVKIADLVRGDIVIVRHGEDRWLSRLAGLPGDRIALVNGIVVLNGKSLPQRAVGRWRISNAGPATEAAMLVEHFPGERRTHYVLDDGLSPGDNFEEITLGPDEYFLLGDNRDNAADSRFDSEFFGLGVKNSNDIERRVTPVKD